MERHFVALLVVSSVVGLAAVVVSVVCIGWLAFERRLANEMRALLLVPHDLRPASVGALPAPVERYRQLAVGTRAPVHTLQLRHGGTFRMNPTAPPSSIRGTQLFTADPPGFVWTGRVRMLPGVWIDARDMSVAGKGSMRVLLDDVVPVADARGSQIDQGSSLRLLAEMVWYPTSLFDGRSVTWSAIDETHARATLVTGDSEVSGIFEFGADGLPVRMTAERFTDKGELRPWGGVYSDWRTVSGMRVPFEAAVTWELDAGPCTYAHWLVDSMEFDAATPRA
jgi:hypothetical protein